MRNISKNIPIQGIVRNTSIASSSDGEMEELINLVHKDGSLRTARNNQKLNINTGYYEEIFVHTSGYRHMIGRNGDKLFWFATADNGSVDYVNIAYQEICEVKEGFKHSQTGNLLTVISESNMFHILFDTKTNKYRTPVQAGFNGDSNTDILPPNDLISFKTEGEVDGEGRCKFVVENENYTSSGFKYDELKVQLSATLETSISKSKEENFFNEGYFLVCTAYELYDGSFALNSRPLLMAPGGVSNFLNNSYNTADLKEDKFGPYKNFYDSQPNYKTSVDSKNNYIETFLNPTDYLYYGIAKIGGVKDLNYKKADVYSDLNIICYKGSDPVSSNSSRVLSAKSINEVTPITLTRVKDICQCTMPVQKLKFFINKTIPDSYKDIIKGVSIFITKPIRSYKNDDFNFYNKKASFISEPHYTDMLNPKLYEQGSGNYNNSFEWSNGIPTIIKPNDGLFTIIPKRKTPQEIGKELSDVSAFYEVAKIPFDNIVKSTTWEEVKPKEGTISNLTAQRVLTEDVFLRTGIFPETVFSYNGRLHLANYKTSLFSGFPLPYFYYYGGLGQESTHTHTIVPATGGVSKLHWFIETTIDTASGEFKVLRYFDNPTYSNLFNLNPILSYPDARATKMRIGINYREDMIYTKEFTLKKHSYLNFSYYMDPNLNAINLDGVPGSSMKLPDVQEEKFIENPNIIRVSAVENPIVFPAKNTYKIGNAKIVGFAANTEDLSTGQVGAAPLYVFSEDGIFALFVDTSGLLAYTNSRPISMDVVNNEKSITSINGGILFSTDRGLMVISGKQVDEISLSIEGLFAKTIDPTAVEYCPECAFIVDNEKTIRLKNTFTEEEFKEYLKESNIAYNYKENEILIANPKSEYTYIYSRGIWSKRKLKIKEFVNDYPRTYFHVASSLYKIGDFTDGYIDTAFVTRAVTFNNTDLKQSNSVVLRGYFEVEVLDHNNSDHKEPFPLYAGMYVYGSYDAKAWSFIGGQEKSGKFRDLGCVTNRNDCKFFKVVFVGRLSKDSYIDYIEWTAKTKLTDKKSR